MENDGYLELLRRTLDSSGEDAFSAGRYGDEFGRDPTASVTGVERHTGLVVPSDGKKVIVRELADANGTMQKCICYPIVLDDVFFKSDCWALVGLAQNPKNACGWKQLPMDTKSLLREFVRLAREDANEKHVRRFAAKWGPLWLCRTHSDSSGLCLMKPRSYAQYAPFPVEELTCAWHPEEPVWIFQRLARTVNSFLWIASRLKNADMPMRDEAEHWRNIISPLGSDEPIDGFRHHELPISTQVLFFAEFLNKWTHQFAMTSFVVEWPSDPQQTDPVPHRPRLTISPGFGFMRHVCMQLMQFVCGAYHLRVCSECGVMDFYARDRSPSGDGRFICPDCGKKERARVWAQNNPKRRLTCPRCIERFESRAKDPECPKCGTVC